MTDPAPPRATRADALADRRWLIGIGVTILFGLFGVVMALLAYRDRTPSPAAGEPPAAGAPLGATQQPAPADAPASSTRGSGKDRGKGRDP